MPEHKVSFFIFSAELTQIFKNSFLDLCWQFFTTKSVKYVTLSSENHINFKDHIYPVYGSTIYIDFSAAFFLQI